MRGLWLEDGKLSCRSDLPRPDVGEEELLVEVTYAGICGTDMELRRGYYDFRGIPGHEFAGTVVDGPASWRGARIVSNINIGCGDCEFCRQGMPGHCPERRVIGIKGHAGAFAEFVSVPVCNAFHVPDEIADREAVLVEPLAAALEILEQVTLEDDARVLVVGAGRLAQLIVQVLAASCSNVDVLVRSRIRLALMEPLNVRCLGEHEIPSHHYDIVVECSGHPDGLARALDATRPRGTLVMKSTCARPLTFDAGRVVVDEISLIGSRCGPFGKAIAWLRDGRIALAHLPFRAFDLEACEDAFTAAMDPAIYKVLFEP